jgi:large subunit ribosomal protein L18
MERKIRSAKTAKWLSRRSRVVRKVAACDHVRLTVFRSAKHIYAQLVDPISGKTIGTISSRSKSVAGDAGTGNVQAARQVGLAVAALAKEKQITQVVFNRNGFLYHGRVKALAEAAREGGLQF